MKLAFLIHTQTVEKPLINLLKTIRQTPHHCFVMVNDENERNEAFVHFSTDTNIHIERDYPYALDGDLSLPRYYLYMMKKALSLDSDIKYFISLHPEMVPLLSNQQILNFLKPNYPTNYYYQFDEPINPKYVKKYYPFTNFTNFTTSKFIQNYSKAFGSIGYFLGFRRKLKVNLSHGSQYFIISDQGAQQLVDNISFLTDNFKLSYYPEQIALITMFNTFMTQPYQNRNLFYIGPKGNPQPFKTVELTQSTASFTNDCLLGGIFDIETHKKYCSQFI